MCVCTRISVVSANSKLQVLRMPNLLIDQSSQSFFGIFFSFSLFQNFILFIYTVLIASSPPVNQ